MLSKQQVLDWQADPVTKAFLQQLQKDRLELAESVISGDISGETVDETAQLLAREVGKAQAIQNILDFAVEDLLKEAVDDKD